MKLNCLTALLYASRVTVVSHKANIHVHASSTFMIVTLSCSDIYSYTMATPASTQVTTSHHWPYMHVLATHSSHCYMVLISTTEAVTSLQFTSYHIIIASCNVIT